MGRRERYLDPEAGEPQRFAHGLRELRETAGSPSYRQLSLQAGFSAPTLSEAASGTRLPTLQVTLAYVRACGGDESTWQQYWQRLSQEQLLQAVSGDGTSAPPPYAGLARFTSDDSALYFGRQDMVARLLDLVAQHRIVGVVGASGSGKSSLLRAGLVPALQSASEGVRPALIRICTPGPQPSSKIHLLTSADESEGEDGADTVVVIDQFEELFTLGTSAAEQRAFIDALLTASAAGSQLRVVLAVRADFFSHCVEDRELAEALNAAALLVPAMGREQLREAITRPAIAHGLVVERELTERIVAEVADQPGGLPLMSHTLLEIWRRRQGKNMTMSAYHAVGGVQGAIAHTAEEAFNQLTDEQKDAVRATLLRLVTPGVGRADTRRPVQRTEFNGSRSSQEVLQQLITARLITADEDTVELAHEALITAWPRLRDWVDSERDRIRLHRKLTDAAQTWDDLERDDGALYRGAQLTAACDEFLAPEGRLADALNSLEQEFLAASIKEHEREVRTAASRDRIKKYILRAVYAAPFAAVALWGIWFLNRSHP